MALIKWEPRYGELEPVRSLRQEVDRLFEDFFRGWPRPWAGSLLGQAEAAYAPSIDLRETDKELVLTAEVPGLRKEDVDVNIQEQSVTIRGERKEEKETKEQSYYYRESSFGSFQRVVPLPVPVAAEKAKAKLKDGVLTLTLPKAEPSKPKGVTIKVD
ncbi:MAG: Hsp20/alpha crystallin family protein [Deferrisomatales bacterium]|nr:Hsp20/alpha crystallin family protein [Deferrisomatales bacterium]